MDLESKLRVLESAHLWRQLSPEDKMEIRRLKAKIILMKRDDGRRITVGSSVPDLPSKDEFEQRRMEIRRLNGLDYVPYNFKLGHEK